jgi:hypothetical protein
MSLKKQISSVIRISQEEGDESARATHLEAATGKFLVTTNERKQMSTKTNFKRIALVAVASLGLGLLSSVPSQAASGFTVTATNGTPTLVNRDSTNAAIINLTGFLNAADSVSITVLEKSVPAASSSVRPVLFRMDSATANLSTLVMDTKVNSSAASSGGEVRANSDIGELNGQAAASRTSHLGKILASSSIGIRISSTADANINQNIGLQLDTNSGTAVAGTYTYTVVVKTKDVSLSTAADKVVTLDVSLTITALASASLVPSAANSSLVFSPSGGGTEAAVSGVATASTTPTGILEVKLRNASSAPTSAAAESVTVTTTLGTVGVVGGTFGRSVVLQYSNLGTTAADSLTVQLRPDGSAGVATITVTTPTITFTTRTATFYAAVPGTLVASALINPLSAGSNAAAVSVIAKDAGGNAWTGTLYAYSATAGVISDTGTSCSYSTSNARHECTLTGVANGTSAITFRNTAASSGIASTTVSSNAVTMTVSTASASTVKLAWNKATYVPGEKATLLVSVLDSTGKSVGPATFANLFTTGGITLSVASGNGSDTVTPVSVTTSSLAAAALGTSTEPVKAYTVYMPPQGGTIVASATGGTSLPIAGQVEVKASATITDNAAAALAAVTALSTTVASLRTLITTLTNLVLKIQKKVKA